MLVECAAQWDLCTLAYIVVICHQSWGVLEDGGSISKLVMNVNNVQRCYDTTVYVLMLQQCLLDVQ